MEKFKHSWGKHIHMHSGFLARVQGSVVVVLLTNTKRAEHTENHQLFLDPSEPCGLRANHCPVLETDGYGEPQLNRSSGLDKSQCRAGGGRDSLKCN